MILSTSKIRVRPWRSGDEPALIRYANNRKVSIHLRDRFPYPYTETDARNWISIASQGTPLANFAIELIGDGMGAGSGESPASAGATPGEAVGGIGLILGDDVYRRSAELGYWLGEPFWGQGIVSEAVSVIVPYAFQAFSLTRIFAAVFDNHPASARVLEKAGFAYEGRLRKSVVKEHEVLDSLLYAIVR